MSNIVIGAVVGFLFGSLGWVFQNLYNRWHDKHIRIFQPREHPKNTLNVLIWGAGHMGDIVFHQLMNCRSHMVNIVGFIDDEDKLKGHILNEREVLGNITDLASIIKKYKIHVIVLAILKKSEAEREQYKIRLEQVRKFCIDNKIGFLEKMPESQKNVEIIWNEFFPSVSALANS